MGQRTLPIVLVGGILIWLFLANLSGPRTGRAGPAQEGPEPSSAINELLLAHEKLTREALDTTLPTREPNPRERPRPETTSEPRDPLEWNEWYQTYERTSFDLVQMFLYSPQGLTSGSLARHSSLNTADQPLSSEEIGKLDGLLARYKSALIPLMLNYHKLKHQEMLDLASTGRIPPAELPARSEDEIRQLARQMAHNAEEEATLLEQYRRNPPVGAAPGSYLVHGGQTYLQSDFGELPLSQRALVRNWSVSIEFLAAVCDWFAVRGLSAPGATEDLLSRALEELAHAEARAGK